MSCGAECLMEMMEFSKMNYLRGNPASQCSRYDNDVHSKPSYNLAPSGNKYAVGNAKQGYNLSNVNYFEMPTKVSRYNIIANPFYKMAAYQMRAANVQRPMLHQEQMPEVKQNIVLSEIDNLEAMILAAKEKELSAWTQ